MTEILERDGKYYRKIEKEEEISEVEFLKEKVRRLEEKVNSLPIIQPAPIVVCPCPCPKREVNPDPYPYQPYQPIWITTTGVDVDTIRTCVCDAVFQALG